MFQQRASDVEYNQYYESLTRIPDGVPLFLPRLFWGGLPPSLRTPECADPGRDRGFGCSPCTLFSCACLSWSFLPFLGFFGRPVGFRQAGGPLDKIDPRDIPNCSISSVFLHSRTNWVKINFLIGPVQF